MKYRKRIVKLILIVTLISLVNYSNVYASTLDDVFGYAKNFISTGESGKVPINGENLRDASSVIYNTLLGAGILIAVIIGVVIGIKFMVSTVDEKAKIKEVLLAYVCGCFVVFGAFGIWRLVVLVLGNI